MNDKVSYEQLEKLSKNPFYTLNAKELAQLKEYRQERYQPPKKHLTTFNKHGYLPEFHNPKLEETDDEQTN